MSVQAVTATRRPSSSEKNPSGRMSSSMTRLTSRSVTRATTAASDGFSMSAAEPMAVSKKSSDWSEYIWRMPDLQCHGLAAPTRYGVRFRYRGHRARDDKGGHCGSREFRDGPLPEQGQPPPDCILLSCFQDGASIGGVLHGYGHSAIVST